MNDIVFKVAPKGEGKTKWLLNVANEYITAGRTVYLYTNDDQEYARFCEKYFNVFHHVCSVIRLTSLNVTSDDVILIDDLFSYTMPISNIQKMQRDCYKLFITVEGTTNFNMSASDYHKLCMNFGEYLNG